MRYSTKKLSIFTLLALLLAACTPTEYKPIDPEKLYGEKIAATTTISELKSSYIKTNDQFSVFPIESDSDLVINGIVTSIDAEGNIYKYIVIQEEEGTNKQAIRISIDEFGLSTMYPLGQRISVKANRLSIGNYGESPQIGTDYFNEKRNRKEPGRLPKIISNKHITAYEKPDPKAVVADTMTIAEILSANREELVYRLICIKNASFTGKGDKGVLQEEDKIFAPSTDGVGYPQAREIKDNSGKQIFIATSEYASFAKKPLPRPEVEGNITAIVGWYRSGTYAGKWQLTLRALGDLGEGFEDYLDSVNYKKK